MLLAAGPVVRQAAQHLVAALDDGGLAGEVFVGADLDSFDLGARRRRCVGQSDQQDRSQKGN